MADRPPAADLPAEDSRPPGLWAPLSAALLLTAAAATAVRPAAALSWGAVFLGGCLAALCAHFFTLAHPRGRAAEAARRRLEAATAERNRAEQALRRGEARYRL